MGLLDKFKLGEPQEVRENKKMIEQTRKKLNQLNLSLDNEVREIENKTTAIYLEIGKMIYEKYKKEDTQNIQIADCQEKIEQIDQQEELLNEVQRRREEVNKRYSEEITMLENLLPKESEDGAGTNFEKELSGLENRTDSCPSCGDAVANSDVFCPNCGIKLDKMNK